MSMDMLAGLYILYCPADDLTVFNHLISGFYVFQGKFMSPVNIFYQCYILSLLACFKRHQSHSYRIGR